MLEPQWVVRFNTDRRNRLAFDDVAIDYRARPDVPTAIVDWCVQAAPLEPGEAVLEVGAGTGQLTSQLLGRGLHVTAVEPGGRLRDALAARLAEESRLTVEGGLFEDLTLPRQFGAVWSANAFHWLDPEQAYGAAHRVLRPGGSLVLIWTLLLVADATVAAELRDERLGGDLVNFVPDSPGEFLDSFGASASDGRYELASSGLFTDPVWTMVREPFTVSAADYASLVLSLANAAAAPVERRRNIRVRLGEDLHAVGIDRVVFDHHAYASVTTAR